jgi:hypothetical protein
MNRKPVFLVSTIKADMPQFRCLIIHRKTDFYENFERDIVRAVLMASYNQITPSQSPQ